jgi:2-methylcitrate dehydratase PrpD
MKEIKDLIRNFQEIDFNAFDENTIWRSKDRIIDIIGCTIGGYAAPGCSILIDQAKEWGGKEESSILIDGGMVPAHVAALVNSAMARALDLETTGCGVIDGKSSPIHISATIIPTALAIAEERGLGGKEVICASVLGEDLVTRIMGASNFNFESGWDPAGVVNGFGAAMVTGKLLRFNEGQMLNAFGMAINQAAGTLQVYYDGGLSYQLNQGFPAQTGVVSAKLAERGYTGVKDPLFSKHGLFSLYFEAGNREVLTKNLGEEFYTGASFKLYPSCRATHSGIEGSLKIIKNNPDFDPDKIEEIIVSVLPGTPGFVLDNFKIRDYPEVDAAFSLQYSVASTLIRRDVEVGYYFSGEVVKDRKVLDLIKKIKVNISVPEEANQGKKQGAPRKGGMYPTIVEVRMKDGRRFVEEADDPKGHELLSPLSEEEKREKFMTCAAFSGKISKENAEKLLLRLYRLEEIENVREIIDLLVSSTSQTSKISNHQ